MGSLERDTLKEISTLLTLISLELNTVASLLREIKEAHALSSEKKTSNKVVKGLT